MSEYQYYEFQTIDRPLTEKEMGYLRSFSSRAHITATSFVVDYSWGSFKGNKDAWMENYFDAFLYLANWGTHELKLRLPSRQLDPSTAKKYCGGRSSSVKEKADKVILSFVSDEEGGGEWVEGEGELSSLISVRAELARGDLRALYQGWLLLVQSGELDDEETEPPVPAGLGRLSASLESLADFLRIDRDLLHVDARASAPLEDTTLEHNQVRAWVAVLPVEDKDDVLTRLIVNSEQALVAELLQRFLKDQAGGTAQTRVIRRTVGELLEASEVYTKERLRIEAEKRAREKARRDREAAIARKNYLDGIVGCEPKLWAEVDTLIATKQPKNYDQAVKLLVDLCDLDARTKGGDFGLRLAALRNEHARKPSLMDRLYKAGL
jgi:hypothetical protein